MKIQICFAVVLFFVFSIEALPQNAAIPPQTLIRIVRAEDERRFDADLQNLMKSGEIIVRKRAALAAGRIGDERAIEFLTSLLERDASADVRQTAAFALGEIESAKAADAILAVLQNSNETDAVRARAVEAAGKIGAANQKDSRAKDLSRAVLDALETENSKTNRNREVVLLGLTAALRTRGEAADLTVAKFLNDKDESIRADALNTLARLRAKNENINATMRLLLSDASPIVRANAARALGAAEDKTALNLLIKAATTDADLRVRVSAIRSLAALKDKTAAAPLLARGERLLAAYKIAKQKNANPAEKNELLEIAAAAGRTLADSNNETALNWLNDFRNLDKFASPENEVAVARIAPSRYSEAGQNNPLQPRISGLAELAQNENLETQKKAAGLLIVGLAFAQDDKSDDFAILLVEGLRALGGFSKIIDPIIEKPFADGLLIALKHRDVFVRATAAELIGEQPTSIKNISALKKAFDDALVTDKHENDAQLAILSALVKLNKMEAVESLKLALDAPDYLVRRHAAQLVREHDLTKEFPNLEAKVGTVKRYNPASGTKLGQIFYTAADYARAVSRKNGQSRAVVTTEKGAFEIEFFPEDAPLAVDNFIRLARSGYFNGVAVHRVVPNFVVQDGDPRGDGNGGPGWQIRCEINEIPYERGMVGMALSGKDTGGSQWFVTHSPQPHLDGGYTVFGRVNETGMKIVDNIARGDRILSVKIIEENVSRKGAKTQRKTR